MAAQINAVQAQVQWDVQPIVSSLKTGADSIVPLVLSATKDPIKAHFATNCPDVPSNAVNVAVDVACTKITQVATTAIKNSIDVAYQDPNGSCVNATRWLSNH